MNKKDKLAKKLTKLYAKYRPLKGIEYVYGKGFDPSNWYDHLSFGMKGDAFRNFLLEYEYCPDEEELNETIECFGEKPTVEWWVKFHTDCLDILYNTESIGKVGE